MAIRADVRSGAPVLVDGREAPVAGRVSMDMIAVDLTDVPRRKVGDEVVCGEGDCRSRAIAAHADTIGYELVCRINERVRGERCEGRRGRCRHASIS